MNSYIEKNIIKQGVEKLVESLIGWEKKCEVCSTRSPELKCPVCGRLVCRECFDKERNMCVICTQTICELCGKRLAIDTCLLCGRRVCHNCMIELDFARRFCKECYEKTSGKPQEELKQRSIKVREKLKSLLADL